MTFLLSVWGVVACAQPYFPVKMNKKWGLIDTSGQMVLQPVYDAIGEFKQYGYAIMQRNGGVGLLDSSGKEIVQPRYNDLKVLDSLLVTVLADGGWQVVNMQGKVVLPVGYDRVSVLNSDYLAFRRHEKWGLVDRYGRLISEPKYDDIRLEKNNVFLTRKDDKLGLLATTGTEILPGTASEISFFNDSLIFYKTNNRWGAVDQYGLKVIPPQYEAYSKISDLYIKLISENRSYIYSLACSSIITKGNYDDYYAFSRRYVMVKKNRQLGLVDWCGTPVLQPQYHEIQSLSDDLFRVNFNGKWGIVKAQDQMVTRFQYDYIAPLRGVIGLVKRGKAFGLVNRQGEEVVAPQYDRIEIEADNRARAYTRKQEGSGDEALTMLEFNEAGELVGDSRFEKHFVLRISGVSASKSTQKPTNNNYVLDKFEWFYSPEHDRWGLRKLEDGSIQMEPSFTYVQVYPDLDFTLVGIEQPNRYEFERTTYRFNMVYGLVKNDIGLLVTDLEFWDVRFEDFYNGNKLARCVFSNGKHGLVDRIGKVVSKDYAFIGAFHNGMARVSVRGRLSGSMRQDRGLEQLINYVNGLQSGHTVVDYTEYDQLFQREATLICEDCEWGYMDTTGTMVIAPRYSYAKAFTNGVGIVEHENKWGMVDRRGNVLLPCRYDGIDFLQNTGNNILRLYVQTPKYGLIDTLGQLAVDAVYDELGSFSEGRLAVKRDGVWGFVNDEGLEVIPCRFREVSNFSEGLAAARIGNSWGFIDKQGNVIIEFKYSRVGNFKNGLTWVATPDGYGYINDEEQTVIAATFDRAHDFEGDIARVVVNGDYGIIDRQGKFVLKPQYVTIEPFNEYGLAIASAGKKWLKYSVINQEGQIVTTQGYNEIQPFREGLAVVKLTDTYGYIDLTGRLVIPCEYSKASAFYEGRAAVQQNGTCGYITKTGSKVVPFEFSRCQDFDGGKAIVYKGIRRAGLVDLQGNLVLEPSVNRLLTFSEGRGLVRDNEYRFYYITEQADLYNGFYDQATQFQHGVAVVQVSGRWGIINRRGIEVIPPKYDKIETFENGYAKVRIEGFTGLSSLDGQLIVKPHYEYISYAGDGIFRVEQGDKIGYFDQSGNWVWTLSK